MPRLAPRLSLATKCQLLFGLAVLLIVSATLLLPWMSSWAWSTEPDKIRAEKIATLIHATLYLEGEDWNQANKELSERWLALTREYELVKPGESSPPQPRLISAAEESSIRQTAPRGFITESFNQFKVNPNELFQWKVDTDENGNKYLRLSMAVRAQPTAPTKDAGTLRGIIDVKVPVHQETRVLTLILLVLSGACGCALAILVFYLITQRVFLSPVRGLRRVAEQVSAGDLNVRSEVKTRDEFQELGDAFNHMLANLQATQTELRTINRSLDVRIGELAETNVALYEANRLKNEFLANVSHELRTPLASIIGFAELARDAVENPPADLKRPIRYANNILHSARGLLDLINDLLDVAKIEAGKLVLHLSEFDPAVVCNDLLDLLRPLAEKKQISLTSELPVEPATMHSDAGRLKQILYNLLSNAIKFTPDGGHVQLQAETHDGKSLKLCVTDSGPGIPADQLEVIFEKFRQLDSSITREYGGTGLGLAITRELVGVLGGAIRVYSSLGQGSTFEVILPLQSPTTAKLAPIRLT